MYIPKNRITTNLSTQGGEYLKITDLIRNDDYIDVSRKFNEKFEFRRGRLNCSLNEENKWRWLGLQFTVETD